MPFSPYTVSLVKSFEGFRSQAYRDIGGVWTIGYGETKGVKPGQTITEPEAVAHLEARLNEFAQDVEKLVTVPLTPNQLGALTSFTYNIGIGWPTPISPEGGAFYTSTLRRRLNAGDYKSVPAQLLRWNKVNGRVIAGLTRRRQAEVQLWNTP